MAISVTQRAIAGNAAAATSIALAFGSNTTSGHALIAIATTDGTAASLSAISDTQGKTWNLVTTTSGTYFKAKVWIAYNCNSAADTITVTTGFNDSNLFIFEVAGLASSDAFDKTASQTQASATSLDSTSTATLSFANELVIGITANTPVPGLAPTVGSGYSNLQTVTTNFNGGGSEEKIVSATTAVSATFGLAANSGGELTAVYTFSDTAVATTTTKTITGKSRITIQTTKTQTGKANISANTAQTNTGKSRIQVTTSRSTTGKAALVYTTPQTITGKSDIANDTTRTITGKSSIDVQATQTITGKAFLNTQQNRTITGKSRVSGITPRTQLGKANIRNNTLKTIMGVARITKAASHTITGKADIVAVPEYGIDRKIYLYKISQSDGTFLGVWQDVITEFTYSQEINSAGSSVEVELARTSDTTTIVYESLITEGGDTIITEDSRGILVNIANGNQIGPGSTVDLNLGVEVIAFYGKTSTRITEAGDTRITEGGDTVVADDGAVTGRTIFTGYIARYVSHYGQQETTNVTIYSYGAELDQYIIENGSDTTVSYLSTDPSDILKDVLDLYQGEGGVVTYGTSTIQQTDTIVSYTFNTNTSLEGVKKALELAPTDWAFYLDMGLNEINYFGRPTDPEHTFILGKHIINLDLEQYIEDITNVVYFTGGDAGSGTNLFKKYTDTGSITAYRRGLERKSDNRVTLEASADIISQSILDRNDAPRYRSNITIASDVYHIEDIKLGQIVGFRNFNNFIDALTMQIVRIDYSPSSVSLQLDTLLPSVPKRLEDIYRNLNNVNTLQNPTAPL